ncbi:MAG: MarR family transcriptional regulator [Deltaproteobacteria bacterium]|nr:MarR family transcriptional regulator [Deltaproteobacteria bacterium]
MRIPLTQFLVLDALSDAGGPLRMTELANAAGLSPSELTRVATDLESREWVERGADPADSRVRLVKTTPAGALLIHEVHSQATAELRGVWSDFTHDEWHGFIDYLQRFEQGLCRVRAKGEQSAPSRQRNTTG